MCEAEPATRRGGPGGDNTAARRCYAPSAMPTARAVRAGRPAPLDVAELGGADLLLGLRGDQLGAVGPGAAELLLLGDVARGDHRQRPALGLGTLGHDHDRVAHAAAVAAVERLDHAI